MTTKETKQIAKISKALTIASNQIQELKLAVAELQEDKIPFLVYINNKEWDKIRKLIKDEDLTDSDINLLKKDHISSRLCKIIIFGDASASSTLLNRLFRSINIEKAKNVRLTGLPPVPQHRVLAYRVNGINKVIT